MPELAEEMYCSQQICIPPSFPYLLRQYAKAAIRTQPPDLLRWSTAYFRCLALNLPPPVKPRLEYPIPKSHFGLTPGWLKALMYQLQNNLSVSFKVLWDRWIGACLQHQNLIEVLCLGAFHDPYAIEWFRFVALCASHLTENLTQTMILVCEILTEEPEGGSAMVPLEVFTDVYRFLAAIDASEGQWLRNLHFTDSLLSLYREPSVVQVQESVVEIEEVVEKVKVVKEKVKKVKKKKAPQAQLGVVISCPDIAKDDYKSEKDFPLQYELLTKGGEEVEVSVLKPPQSRPSTAVSDEDDRKSEQKKGATSGAATDSQPSTPTDTSKKRTQTLGEGSESIDTITDYMPERQRDLELEEDLRRLRVAQQVDVEDEAPLREEEPDGVDGDIERLKRLLEGPTGSGLIESDTFASDIGSEKPTEVEDEELEEEEGPDEEPGELVWVDAVPGIGPIVPEELVEAVVAYMAECSKIQHGMVMPRNVRHYNCPPLEVAQK